MATHSGIVAWRISRSEEPGGLHTVHGVAKNRTWLKLLGQGGTANSVMQSRIKLRLQSGEEEKYYGNRV